MKFKNSLADYTESEFLEFMEEIFKENVAKADNQLDILLEYFEKVTEHPEGTDLIYFASSDAESTPQAIIDKVKEWRAAHGKPGFKTD